MSTRISDFIQAGSRPSLDSLGINLILRNNRNFTRLSNDSGNLTQAGRRYQNLTNTVLPESGFMAQEPRRSGNFEFINLRTGRGVTRRYNTTTQEWDFTALGLRFYRRLRRNIVAHVPVTIRGRRRNNTTYTTSGLLPISRMGISAPEVALDQQTPRRHAKIREGILAQLPTDGPIYVQSEEQFFLDESAPWLISEETVGVNPDTGRGVAYVANRRRVGVVPLDTPLDAKPILDVSPQFYRGDQICPEAWEKHDDKLCVQRQIAAILKLDMDEVCNDFEALEPGVTKLGCTADLIYQYAEQHNLGMVALLNNSPTLTRYGSPILAYHLLAEHAYFYSSQATAKKVLSFSTFRTTERLKRRYMRDRNWIRPVEVGETFEAGHYFCNDIDSITIRMKLLEQGILARVDLKDDMRIKTLRFGKTTISVLPEHWEKIERWCQALKIPYAGQGLANISFAALQALMKRNNTREILTKEQKAELYKKCDYKCAFCNSRSTRLEIDHIIRHSEAMGGAPEVQILCQGCHLLKTNNESQNLDQTIFASSFSKRAWTDYVESPKLPPLVYKHRECEQIQQCMIADVRRCRRRALEYCPYNIPVYCPLDDIQERTECKLGDLNFCTKKATNPIWQLGYQGPGFQHRALTEHLLYHGIIQWCDISMVYNASGYLPSGIFTEPLRQMDEAWGDETIMPKLSVNALIGLMSCDTNIVYKHFCSTMPEDAPPEATLRSFISAGGKTIYDAVVKTRLLSNNSFRPVHDLCLSVEAARVGQMLYMCKAASMIPFELKTDSVLFKPQKRNKIDISQTRFRDLDQLRQKFTGAPGIKKLDQYIVMTPIPSDERPFRAMQATEDDKLKCQPRAPEQAPHSLQLEPLQWSELTKTEAEAHVIKGGNLFVEGIPGVGKTVFCKQLVERLRSLGKRCAIISKTHVASSRIGGHTADNWVRRRILSGNPAIDVLWIDEISQLNISLLAQIGKLQWLKVQFILSGDRLQFQPIGNFWRAGIIADDALYKSAFLWDISDGKRLTLTECLRSDKELFSAFSILPSLFGKKDSLSELLVQYKLKFPVKGPAVHNLCISHTKRMAINRIENTRLAPKDALYIKVGKHNARCQAQSFFIWPGLKMLGCVSQGGIKNGVLYEVVSCGDTFTLKNNEIEREYTKQQLIDCFRLSNCTTIASCQGTEFDESLCLHETSHPMMTARHLYVGLSRARSAELVSIK